jgi:cystathionine beta-lyase/cystathionine gamma-synthase
MTHKGVSEEERRAAGVTPGLVRLAVGCEDLDDIRADLAQALDVAETVVAERGLAATASTSGGV